MEINFPLSQVPRQPTTQVKNARRGWGCTQPFYERYPRVFRKILSDFESRTDGKAARKRDKNALLDGKLHTPPTHVRSFYGTMTLHDRRWRPSWILAAVLKGSEHLNSVNYIIGTFAMLKA